MSNIFVIVIMILDICAAIYEWSKGSFYGGTYWFLIALMNMCILKME